MTKPDTSAAAETPPDAGATAEATVTEKKPAKAAKAKKADKPDKPEAPARTIIRVKEPHAWGALLQAARENHWRRLQVTIQVNEWLLAGKPANLDAANAMLKARGLEDQIEAVADLEDPILREQAAERIRSDEGLCEFSRRPGKPGIWLPANNIKAGMKENWSVAGKMNEVRGSRKAIAEGAFIFCGNSWDMPPEDRDWIYLGDKPALHPETALPFHTAVSHSQGPKGPVSSIKRHEFVDRPKIVFDMYIAKFSSVSDKFSDDDISAVLVHFEAHGLGACRSQGFGKFTVLEVRELGETNTTPASGSVPSAPQVA